MSSKHRWTGRIAFGSAVAGVWASFAMFEPAPPVSDQQLLQVRATYNAIRARARDRGGFRNACHAVEVLLVYSELCAEAPRMKVPGPTWAELTEAWQEMETRAESQLERTRVEGLRPRYDAAVEVAFHEHLNTR